MNILVFFQKHYSHNAPAHVIPPLQLAEMSNGPQFHVFSMPMMLAFQLNAIHCVHYIYPQFQGLDFARVNFGPMDVNPPAHCRMTSVSVFSPQAQGRLRNLTLIGNLSITSVEKPFLVEHANQIAVISTQLVSRNVSLENLRVNVGYVVSMQAISAGLFSVVQNSSIQTTNLDFWINITSGTTLQIAGLVGLLKENSLWSSINNRYFVHIHAASTQAVGALFFQEDDSVASFTEDKMYFTLTVLKTQWWGGLAVFDRNSSVLIKNCSFKGQIHLHRHQDGQVVSKSLHVERDDSEFNFEIDKK